MKLVGSNSLGLVKVVDGKNRYVHIMYAIDGAGKGMTKEPLADSKYIGILTSEIPTPSQNPNDYAWAKFTGEDGDPGKDGVPGKDGIGVASTTMLYAKSSDGLNPPSIGWTNTIPETLPGDYLWTEITWRYTDSTEENSYSVSKIGLDGNTGSDGAPGKDGVGLKGTKIEYAASLSGTVVPTSGWSLSIPSVSAGQYLWTKTVWTYTDNTTETGHSVSRMGLDGSKGKDGADGVAGKDGVGIKSTDITYTGSTNGTTIPTTGWTETIPTVPSGSYLWTKTVWTYTDNTTETGYTVSRIGKNGNTGKDGIAGKDGVGLENTLVQYSQSTSGTVPPTSGWSSSVPTVPSGNYLWTKTTWTYTDDTNEVGYSVARMGTNGKDGTDGIAGKDGVGLKDTVIEYAQSSSGTVKPTSDWSTDIPSVPSGSYLWTRTTWTYTDNTAENGYTVSRIGKDGNTGKDGIAGKDGVGISGTKVEYAGSTSGTTKPTSVWTLTIPSVAAGNYLWTKTTWTYTDGTNETGYSVAKMGETGLDGESSYTWVRYSPNADGSNMTAEPTSTSKYIGVAITSDNNPPTDYKLYSWALIKGADGRGVKSTDISYQVSASGTTTPTGTWSTTVPAVPKGQYLWTRILITYTDNTNTASYSISYQGVDGLANIMGLLTNESITLPADSSGSVLTYAGAEGVFEVYEGTNRKTGTPVEYKILSKTNMEVSISTDGAYKVSSVSTGSSIRNAYATLRASYGGITIDKQLNLSKAFTGAQGNNGKDGVAGKDGVGIKSTVVNYSQSTSGTTQPTSGWGTAVPTVPAGNYLWTRTVWTYTDSTKETGYTVSRIGKDGNTGKDGIAGKDGVGLQSTKVEYAHSTSGTTAPITGWTLNVPTVPSGSFLWTKSTWTYTDNTTETGYSVARMGSNGATGATGATGASATSYWITASNNIIGKSQTGVINPTTITFKGFSKTGTANSVAYSGRFIIQTSTNGTTYATRYTSSANQNAYTYTIPADSLFVKCLFYMAGGTTFLLDEQTVPIVESAEGIQVGGENILQNTSFQEGLKYWSVYSQHTTTVADGVITLKNRSGQRWPRLGNISPRLSEIKKGDIYTLSFEAKGDTRTGDGVALSRANSSNTIFRKYVDYSPEWKRYTLTFTASLDWVEGVRLEVWTNRDASTSELTTSYRKFKLEKGTVATDWTPAPEDARTYKAWANSADGGADFTRVYPNENLLLESNQSVTTSSYEVRNYPLADDTLTETDDVVITLKGALGADRANFNAYNSGGVSPHFPLVNIGNGIYQYKGKWSVVGTNSFLRVYQLTPEGTSSSTIEWIKLERGTTPTIYTTNPSDSLTGSIPKYVGFSPLDSENPTEFEWIVNPEYTQALADESLANKADKGVVNELQTVLDLFLESYEGFVEDGGQHEQDLLNLEQRITQILVALEDKVFELDFLKTYMKFGEEGFMIGKDDSQIKMLLKNDRLSFIDAGQEVAFFSGQSFHINRGAIVQSLQVGQHKLTNLSNGHTIFQYVG